MECERSSPGDPLRQGDIIAAQPETEAWKSPWRRSGVVLSADCDLAHRKTGPTFVYAPIISHHAYLSEVWLPAEAEKFAQRGREMIDRRLAEFDARVSSRHLEAWSKDGGAEGVATRLSEHLNQKLPGAPLSTKTAEIVSLWTSVAGLTELARPRVDPATDLRPLLVRLLEHRSAIEPFRGAPLQSHRAMIENALSATQDRLDTWLIRELIGLDPDMTQDSQFGFIVPLRYFSVLPMGCVEVDRSRWYNRQEAYLRICRLRGIYKTDLGPGPIKPVCVRVVS